MSMCFLVSILLLQTALLDAANWKFAVYGDTRPGNSYDHSQNVYAITYKIPNSERVLVLNTGDLTWDGTTAQWSSFMQIIQPLNINWALTNPPQYLSAVGNHDVHDANWAANWAFNLSAQKGLSAYAGIAADPQGLYGSVKYENALFMWVNAIQPDAAQETFIEKTLIQAAVDPQIIWRFVVFHRPPVRCGGTHADYSTGKLWHDKYLQPYGVDIIFLGDNHYYERTCPFKAGLAATSDSTDKTPYCDELNRGNYVVNSKGVIHIVAGGGGAEIENDTPTAQCGWLESNFLVASLHHFLEIEIAGPFLRGRVWDTDTGVGTTPQLSPGTDFQLIDEFTVQKGPAAPSPPRAPANLKIIR